MAFLDMFKFWQREDEIDAQEQEHDQQFSFAAPDTQDGATEVETNHADNAYQTFHQNFFHNSEPKVKTTKELINMYRTLADYHEVDNAVQEIVFEAIVFEDDSDTISLELADTNFSPKIKERIHDELKVVLSLLKFNQNGDKLFRRWYIDSRIYFHKILHKDPKNGIQELRILDPRRIEFVREFEKETREGIDYVTKINEFFVYDTSNEDMANSVTTTSGVTKLRLPRNMVSYAHSGLTDCSGQNIISYIHKAQKPANQLKMLEDALVIYRITRAPERRVFYIDVGSMPNKKATQHVNNIMNGLKNRVVYDSSTGKVKNQHNNLSMTEDYWLMRRDGKNATEVSSLPGAQSMGTIEDVQWFNKKLYESLHIPLSRMPNENGGMSFGNGSEITRDELKFSKYIRSLQTEFKEIFMDPLKTNLILKGIITKEEWDENENDVKFVFNKDSYYEELQETEILERRIAVMESLREYVGRYVSNEYVQRNILRMTEDEILEQREIIIKEKDDEIYKDPALEALEIEEL
jgi:hypothetical protein